VIVRNPEALSTLPRETLRFAAALAARHSKASGAGQVSVRGAGEGREQDERRSSGQVSLSAIEASARRPS
jgi:hypothetical protein